MHRKYFFTSTAAAILLLMATVSVSAQIQRLTGKVTLKQADGQIVPLEKATVKVYRTDRGGEKEATTDKKGKYTMILDVAGEYVMALSAPNAQPKVIPNVGPREQDFDITLDPGDGRTYTKEEVMAALSGKPVPTGGAATGATATTNTQATSTATPTPAVNPEENAKREEVKRKNEEIAAKNKKVEESNAIVIRTFKAGNEALKAKRYDEAITLYKEGLAADPEQASLLTNISVALRERGLERYRAAKDDASRATAKKDFTDALEAATKALDLVKAESVPTDASAKSQQDLRKRLALFAKAEAMRRYVSLVDKAQADAGMAAYDELIAVLTDPAQKLEYQLAQARMLFDAGVPDKAAVAYEKILASNPENVDATLYAGLALYGTGDKAKFQQAANYLQKFVEKAPDTHPIKSDAKAVLENLKNQEKVEPQRTSGRRRG